MSLLKNIYTDLRQQNDNKRSVEFEYSQDFSRGRRRAGNSGLSVRKGLLVEILQLGVGLGSRLISATACRMWIVTQSNNLLPLPL